MSPIDINYDIYYGKHCARCYGWLPASKSYKKHIKKSPKYFTLCGPQAIDVFMFEMEGVLVRDKNKKLPNVIVCEEIEKFWQEIITTVRPPVEEAIIMGKLEELILYEGDDEVRELLEKGDSARPNKEQREKLDRYEKAHRFKDQFPFDIINFDPCDSLLTSNLEENKLYQAFKRIFELQRSTNTFLLFVTTKITDIHSDVQSQFKRDFEANVSTYSDIRDTLSSDSITTYDDIGDENKRKAIGFAKSVVMSVARSKGWNCEHQGIYVYEYESGGTRMLSLVVKLSKADTEPNETAYVQDVIQIIKSMPKYYPYREYDRVLTKDPVKEHLEGVKKYREKIRDEYK